MPWYRVHPNKYALKAAVSNPAARQVSQNRRQFRCRSHTDGMGTLSNQQSAEPDLVEVPYSDDMHY